MGLTDTQKRLIKAIASDDIVSTKKLAIACVVEDTTGKNKEFCSRYKTMLETTSTNLTKLPSELSSKLYMEDVSISFNENRYYLSPREKSLFNKISQMKVSSMKLMEMGIIYNNFTLLYGESGTGKTTFGRYVAYKLGLPFCYLNFANIIDSGLGRSAKNLSSVFDYVRSHPCIFMLDEIDYISIKRSNNHNDGASSEINRLTITLMQEFDKLTNDIIVIGATNRKDILDEAILRRFSNKHEVKVLQREEMKEMIKKYLLDINMDFPESEIDKLLNEENINQTTVLNKLINMIALKIA